MMKKTVILGDHASSRKDSYLVDHIRIKANSHFINEKYDSAAYYYTLINQSIQQSESDYLYYAVALFKNKN